MNAIEEIAQQLGIEVVDYNDVATIRESMPALSDEAFKNYMLGTPAKFVKHLADAFRCQGNSIIRLQESNRELKSTLNYEIDKSKGIDKDEIGNLLYEAMKGDADRDELRTKCIALIGEEDYAKLVIDDSDIDSEDADLIKDLL